MIKTLGIALKFQRATQGPNYCNLVLGNKSPCDPQSGSLSRSQVVFDVFKKIRHIKLKCVATTVFMIFNLVLSCQRVELKCTQKAISKSTKCISKDKFF